MATFVNPNGVQLDGICLGSSSGEVEGGVFVQLSGNDILGQALFLFTSTPTGIDYVQSGNLVTQPFGGSTLESGFVALTGIPDLNSAGSVLSAVAYAITDVSVGTVATDSNEEHFYPGGAGPVRAGGLAAVNETFTTFSLIVETSAPSFEVLGPGAASIPLPAAPVDAPWMYQLPLQDSILVGVVAFSSTQVFSLTSGNLSISDLNGTYVSSTSSSQGIEVLLDGGSTVTIPLAPNGRFSRFGPASQPGMLLHPDVRATPARWPPRVLKGGLFSRDQEDGNGLDLALSPICWNAGGTYIIVSGRCTSGSLITVSSSLGTFVTTCSNRRFSLAIGATPASVNQIVTVTQGTTSLAGMIPPLSSTCP